jgi:hypothetical protein
VSSEPETSAGKRDLSPHILSTSVHLIGFSTTLIGLVKVAEAHIGPSHVARYAGLAALVFLFSAGASYLSIHYANQPGVSRQLEWIADIVFTCGLVGITAIAILFAFEVI